MQAEQKSRRSTLPPNVPSSKTLASREDCPSGHASISDGELAHNLQESVRLRIFYLSEQLKVETVSRDVNTMSYLKLVSKADRHQAPYIRQAFEKVNQRASATIAQIEQRLRQCHQQLQELESCRFKGSELKVESSLKTCQQPRVKALASETSKVGGEDGVLASLPDLSKAFSLKNHLSGLQQGKISDAKSVAKHQKLLLEKVKENLKEISTSHIGLQVSYQSLKERYLRDLQESLESLREGKFRQALMEEQVNDHLQVHLDEIYHLKQNLACTEEKMAYLSYERDKEIWEVMETFKGRISKLESLQEVTEVGITAKLRSCPLKVLFRLVSLLLTLATILLVFVSMVCSCPFTLVNSRLRTCTTLILLGLGVLVWHKWHTIDWQAWSLFRWSLDSKDTNTSSDGP
ncbi:testis-specific protein TEX28 [Perognathus longimembris pacificus]|uniref:testis-specific protein TEX28 n=1 Tax=Perognathus longimembris pacificus TaxID=214514 RepID=UPI002019970D|nr:testis-specific protein TEX28 [Perognathus longimembris pacificus]